MKGLLKDLGKFVVRSENIDILHAALGPTRVSFLGYSYPLLEKPLLAKSVPAASVVDTGCMKLGAITERGHKRDFRCLRDCQTWSEFEQIGKRF